MATFNSASTRWDPLSEDTVWTPSVEHTILCSDAAEPAGVKGLSRLADASDHRYGAQRSFPVISVGYLGPS